MRAHAHYRKRKTDIQMHNPKPLGQSNPVQLKLDLSTLSDDRNTDNVGYGRSVIGTRTPVNGKDAIAHIKKIIETEIDVPVENISN